MAGAVGSQVCCDLVRMADVFAIVGKGMSALRLQ